MQLFSIGLEKLNGDGTSKKDSSGKRIRTYNNDDITEYARLWTGFTCQTQRGNIEMRGSFNAIDPMTINLQWRDTFPKMGLDKKYIGDGFVLCSDLPSKSFLSTGAKYRLLGNMTQSDILDTSDVKSIPQLDPSSSLFKLLCNSNSNGMCSFAGVVTLSYNLSCEGIECTIPQDPHIVQVTESVYYEYVKPACVNFPFSSTEVRTIVIADDGKIALTRNEDPLDSLHSLTYFRVQWQNKEFPNNSKNQCGGGVCEVWNEKCLCRTSAAVKTVFNSLPRKEQILTQLHIAAPSPYLKDYINVESHRNFAVLSTNSNYTMDTAFKVEDHFGRTLYLKNMASNAILLRWDNDTETKFTFRNPPSFYGHRPEVKDAYDETDAGLDHYVYHQNTAPFMALHFIKRFGLSNPSPRYVEAVSLAFTSGRYKVSSAQGDVSFGSGKYGDLAATVAGVLLDSESRETLLDFDPSYGSIREPIVKVISLMRSLEFSQTDGEYKSLCKCPLYTTVYRICIFFSYLDITKFTD